MKLLLPLFLAFTILIGCNNSDCGFEPNLNVDQFKLQSDIDSIIVYLDKNNIEAQVHPSGLRYVINEEGSGKRPGNCDVVRISFEGRLLSTGAIVEETDFEIRFIMSSLIKGLQIGLPLIKNGGSITLYIPSGYGYERADSESLSPVGSNLIFDVQLTDVEK